jgi:DNA-binding beta-propeller fold protein YncE
MYHRGGARAAKVVRGYSPPVGLHPVCLVDGRQWEPTVPRSLACVFVAGLLLLPACLSAAAEPAFEHVMNIGADGTGKGQFKYVEDFAFSKDGHLLVTDAALAAVQVFDKSGNYLGRFGGKGNDDRNFDKPEGIAVDPDGNIFVADYISGYIKKFDASYRWLKTFSEYGAGKGQNIKSEFMTIGHDRLYLAEAGNHRIDVFDLDGNFLFDFGGPGTEPGKFNTPESVEICGDGNLYVTDLKNDRIQVFDKDGRPLWHWGRSGSAPGEFKSPAGLACDGSDNVYVTEIGNNRVQVFDKSGRFLTSFGRAGSGSGEFGNLHGIIVDKPTGTVYVADTANSRVQVFRPVLGTVGASGAAR